MVTATATAVLQDFPAEFDRLTHHDHDKDAIGVSQFIAFYLLVGTATRALRKGKLWRDLSTENRDRGRMLASEFLSSCKRWEQLPLRDRWAELFSKPRETIAINLLWTKMRDLANAMLTCIAEEDRRAAVVASLYASAVSCVSADESELYVTLSSEQIRSRSC